MQIIITAAPGPAKLIRRKLYDAVRGITSIASHPTIAATRDAIGSHVPDLFVAVGRRSPRALGRFSHHLGELSCAQLLCSGLDADNLVYRNGTELPNVVRIPAEHNVAEAIVEVTRQLIASRKQEAEAIARRHVQVGVGREVRNIVKHATRAVQPMRPSPKPLLVHPVLAEIRRMAEV